MCPLVNEAPSSCRIKPSHPLRDAACRVRVCVRVFVGFTVRLLLFAFETHHVLLAAILVCSGLALMHASHAARPLCAVGQKPQTDNIISKFSMQRSDIQKHLLLLTPRLTLWQRVTCVAVFFYFFFLVFILCARRFCLAAVNERV